LFFIVATLKKPTYYCWIRCCEERILRWYNANGKL